MFFLLPRTADAALSTLISHRIRMPGFSDHVTLGDIGEFKTSSRPVMHIAIYGNQPMGSAKWRGDVLSDFDGRVWSGPDGMPDVNGMRVSGGQISLGIACGPATQLSRGVHRSGIADAVFRRRLRKPSRDCRMARVIECRNRMFSPAAAAALGLSLRRLQRSRRTAGNRAAALSSADSRPEQHRDRYLPLPARSTRASRRWRNP